MICMTIDGTEYVAIPRAEYIRLTGGGTVEALPFIQAALGKNLKAAREHAGLTQAELAKKLKKAQATVSLSESGRIQVSEAYVGKVLKICGLPDDWKAP
jgi:ribosome-binding protein aMBF1 (putative translation factor)